MSKVIFGVTLSDRHELNLSLIKELGPIPQERDLAVEAWDALPVKESTEIVRQVCQATSGPLMKMFDDIDKDLP